MTTYGNKYIFNFISQNGDEVEVCIQKKNYSGSFVRRPVGRGPVLKRERNGAILGTSLELYAECRIDQEYVELYTSSADEFRVLVYKNRELQWTGFVSPELYAEPDIAPPYDVQIIATDGLGELKNTLFDRPDESYPLGDHIDYILRKTGLSLSVDLISSLSWDDEAHNNSPSSLLSLTANLTHLASNSDYDVLQDILTSFNACITQQAGRWMIVRKTDIYNNIPLFRTAAFGSVNKTTWWPIGSLSADIVPAKRKLTLTHENNYKDSILPGLISGVSGGWEFATGVYYNDSEKAYILSDEDYIIYAMEFPVYPISVPLKLSINARPLFNSSEEDRAVLGYFVELEGTVNGVRGTYYLVHSYDDALGRAVWRWYPERIPLMHTWWREELPEDVEQEVTTVNAVLPLGDNIRPDRIRLIVQNYPIISKYAIAVYDIALAQNDQIRGLKLIAEVGNNARESVETSVVISSSADPMLAETMYGVLRLDGGITSWHTPYNAASDLLKFLAADYAMLTALPAIRYRGTLNVPAQVTPWIPFIFERDNTYYLLETYSYDLLLDELEVELVSIPNSRVSIESETIIEITAGGLSGSGTVSGGGGSSSGGGSGEGDNEGSTLIVDSEMDDESENAVQNKVIKAYVDAADNLIKEEIERLKQQFGADTPSSFYHDMTAIVSHTGMITRQTREQLYNIFTYTEGNDISSEPAWVIDTNGQHYIVRMLQTETGVGFFIIGYEGFTRIEGDNTKTNQLLRDKADKKYVDDTFFSQAQFDQIASNQYVVGNVAYQTDSDTGLRRLSLSLGLRIQNDIDAAVNDRPDDNGNYTNGLVTALGVKNWVESKGYLTSAAMDGYATKLEIKDFVTKGTTLEHYGITDAVKNEGYLITPDSSSPAVGFATYNNGWPYQGSAMLLGAIGASQLRLITTLGNSYLPEIFVSGRYLDNESAWARVITDKNIGAYSIALRTADSSENGPKPTDTSAFSTYVYGTNGWAGSGPALAFPNGGWSGLINIISYDPTADPNNYPRMKINITNANTGSVVLGQWVEVVTDKNFSSYGLAMKTNQYSIDLDEIGTGLYDLTGAIANSPLNYGSLLNIKGYFSAQLIFNASGDAAYYRTKSDREVDGTKWRPWRTIIDSNNVSSYVQSVADSRYLKLASGGTVQGQIYVETSSGDRYIHSKCSTAHIAFGVGSGGNNRGIFDIKDGKWWILRNNSDYTEIVSSTMALVGNVRVGGVLEARSGITLGNVTRISWPTEGIAKNSILLPNNVFDSLGKIQFSQLDNALYAANHRFNVTLNGFASDTKTVLFNGSYEDSIQVPMGQTATIKIDNNGNDIISGYPYGKIILSFYYQSVPESVSIRVYTTYGTAGWYSLPLSEIRGTNGGVFVFDNSYYAVKEVEITITAKSDINAALSEIDWFLNRASLSNLPVVTKFAIDQELYGRLICKGGITLGGETINSWADVRSNWAGSGQTVNSGETTIEVVSRVKKSILTTLTNSHRLTFTLNQQNSPVPEWIIRFKTGSSVPSISISYPNQTLVWQNKQNILSGLKTNTEYRIYIDGTLAMYETF